MSGTCGIVPLVVAFLTSDVSACYQSCKQVSDYNCEGNDNWCTGDRLDEVDKEITFFNSSTELDVRVSPHPAPQQIGFFHKYRFFPQRYLKGMSL
ncbi:hypothetical protein NIES4073_01590 (plasmid) [Kalymmatonema gypsitolerans NIES-4073]|jgi:hypothetical protein|nr:hypothetical protein NIES4073_01590 [Scytonema sp. NIES-4073]